MLLLLSSKKLLISVFHAWVDINCLKLALNPYLNQASRDEAAKPLLDFERPGDKEVVTNCKDQFKMNFHLTTFQNKESAQFRLS